MFELTGVTRVKREPPKESSERIRIIHRAARDYPGYETALLDSRFDPAFLHFIPNDATEVAVAVYCRDLASEVIASEVAGLTLDRAEEELYLLLNTFPSGKSPWVD
jgi:hypothetical protein